MAMRRLLPLTTCVATLAVAAPALAHVEVKSTSPKKGTTAKGTVRAVTITFTGPLITGKLTVFGPNGRQASVDAGGRDPRNTSRLVTEMRSGLKRGTYTAKWRIRADDGHSESGSFTFRVSR